MNSRENARWSIVMLCIYGSTPIYQFSIHLIGIHGAWQDEPNPHPQLKGLILEIKKLYVFKFFWKSHKIMWEPRSGTSENCLIALLKYNYTACWVKFEYMRKVWSTSLKGLPQQSKMALVPSVMPGTRLRCRKPECRCRGICLDAMLW
jgi:hypothetical protein